MFIFNNRLKAKLFKSSTYSYLITFQVAHLDILLETEFEA